MAWHQKRINRARFVWIIAGCLVIGTIVVAFVRDKGVHVTNVRGTKVDGNFVVKCDIVNPKKETVTVVATSTISAPSTNREYGIDRFPPIKQTVELNGNESKSIEFSHPCNTPGPRVRPIVTIEVKRDPKITN